MRLGMIGQVSEGSFHVAKEKELDFLEFCINVGYDVDSFLRSVPEIKQWQKKYGVSVQSIGRWGADKHTAQGSIIPEELTINQDLIAAAAELGCPNYVCGVSYVDSLSLYTNAGLAIDYLAKLLDTAEKHGVKLAVYNCRWGNWVAEPQSWELVLGHLPEVGIKYDPSHCVYDGGDYLQETRDWGKRFYHIHLKGSLQIDGQRYDDPPAGMDQTNWGAFMAVLYAQGYSGGVSIEPHSPTWEGELLERGLDYTVKYFKRLLFR
ncbi:MAG: sugar phosphate isomerase/epimerase [Firmicutes bacterium]|nr:sugar phosphate isomerase/epimerase [Bacillota bacterium]